VRTWRHPWRREPGLAGPSGTEGAWGQRFHPALIAVAVLRRQLGASSGKPSSLVAKKLAIADRYAVGGNWYKGTVEAAPGSSLRFIGRGGQILGVIGENGARGWSQPFFISWR
jgi:hypothetical protein